MMTKRWNDLWLWSNRKYHQEFFHNIKHIEKIQHQILLNYINKNKNTLFGRNFNFSNIKTYEDYKNIVPLLSDYEDIRHYICKIERGDSNILTSDSTLFFETTSGSTGKAKLIPYNQPLKNEFQKGIAVWLHELRKQYPKALNGKSYWSLSPPMKERHITPSGLPVGTASDDEYFNLATKWILKQIMAVDNSVLQHTDPYQFYLNTCRQLLAAENLSFFSVWSPSFFLLINDFIGHHFDAIVSGIKDSRRRKALMRINEFQWAEIFPNLEVISCWTDAHASLWTKALQAKTGKITIQPKGLLSTEGIVTLPTLHGNSIAYTSHFFEFIHLDNHQIYLVHELEIHNHYEVVITTGGGLYRYKTKDVVQVMGMVPYPILKFEGRSGVVSDLVGEKIDQLVVQKIFHEILQKYTYINALLLQPILTDKEAYYQLYLFSEDPLPVQTLLMEVHDRLKENPYYLQAINLGQLGPLRAKPYPSNMLNNIASAHAKQGSMKDGDAKLPVLLPITLNFGQ